MHLISLDFPHRGALFLGCSLADWHRLGYTGATQAVDHGVLLLKLVVPAREEVSG